jgi:hypothetical protein
MPRRLAVLAFVVVAAATTILFVPGAARTSGGVSGAIFTSINEPVDGTGHCKNSANNCNIYDSKDAVWMNGGPSVNGLDPEGYYFFAVLSPGGQPDPNEGAPDLLSTDSTSDRTFQITGGEVSAYSGPHDMDSGAGAAGDRLDAPDGAPPLIRLIPYDDSPHGVYIMAVCYLGSDPDNLATSVDAHDCKYDAFKVQEGEGPAQVNACFSGMKYRDDNKDGALSPGEIGLENWTINIDNGVDPPSTTTTDSDGNWSLCLPDHESTSGSTDFDVSETLETGWKETGNVSDSGVITAGGASVSLTSFVYTVTVPNNAIATASGLDFGNIPQGTVSGDKYYDSVQNGIFDALETLLTGWKITQGGAASANLTSPFSVTLDPGIYTFTEVQATNGWTQTGNVSDQSTKSGGALVSLLNKVYTVTIPTDQPSSVTGLYFGNVCSVSPGGLTIGFWSNKNGLALITAADFTNLNAFYLRNANGGNRDFVDTLAKNKTDYSKWLVAATATNMAYMLSAQMSATYLNVVHGQTNGSIVVDGTRTVSQEIAYANSLLANPIASGTFAGQNGSVTVQGSALRTEQERVKNILDKINNGGSFGQPSPGTCPTPIFP